MFFQRFHRFPFLFPLFRFLLDFPRFSHKNAEIFLKNGKKNQKFSADFMFFFRFPRFRDDQ